MKSRRVYFQTFPPAGQWAGAVGRGEGWWSVAGTDEVDKPRVPLPCDPAWGSWPPTPDSSHPPHPRQAYLGQHCPPPSPSQWGGRQTRSADLDRVCQPKVVWEGGSSPPLPSCGLCSFSLPPAALLYKLTSPQGFRPQVSLLPLFSGPAKKHA